MIALANASPAPPAIHGTASWMSLHAAIGIVRLDASLNFVTAAALEDAVLKLERDKAQLKFILLTAGGIHDLDATGAELLLKLAERLKQNGTTPARHAGKTPGAGGDGPTGAARPPVTDFVACGGTTGMRSPLELPGRVGARIYRQAAWRSDLVNYLQAIGDALEPDKKQPKDRPRFKGLLKNDYQIKSWDGSRLDKDADCPRIEVTITPEIQ